MVDYRRKDAYVIIYDITDRESLNRVRYEIDTLPLWGELNALVAIVGNKCDLENKRQVSYEEVQQFVNEIPEHYIEYFKCIRFFEVSCKNNINVSEPFMTYLSDIYQRHQEAGLNRYKEKKFINVKKEDSERLVVIEMK